MVVVGEIRKRARFILGPVFGIGLLAYFAYHLVEGERGLGVWLRLTQQVKQANATLAAVEQQRETLDHRVALLRPDHLDRDMLDERARATLNLAAPNDLVIFNGDAPR